MGVFLFCHKMPPMNPIQTKSACYQFFSNLHRLGGARFIDWPSGQCRINRRDDGARARPPPGRVSAGGRGRGPPVQNVIF